MFYQKRLQQTYNTGRAGAADAKKIFLGGRGSCQVLVEPRDIVLNQITHVVTKELPEGLVARQIIGGGGRAFRRP